MVGGELKVKEIRGIIRRYRPHSIRWSGGEPFEYLTRAHLDIAGELFGMDVVPPAQIVTTNGSLPGRTVELAGEGYFDEVRVSLYRGRGFHEGVTGRRRSFRTAIRTVRELRGMGARVTLTSPVWNAGQAEQVAKLAENLGAGCRLTALVSHTGSRIGNTCTTGSGRCWRGGKKLVMPDGGVVNCAAEKRGFGSPFRDRGVPG